ncbi:MAG: hypothetical protein KR126chlam4_00478 [Candidatus Anoxychlamydiales bacterium]|uniref:Uncharacterized protein n=1 Tax=marine sediment metagenome TaxID=412755 RepID=A0A0F9JCQ1_9ZZZZ|nr:hypothetical protein [Candidatus Anoxychlamydiales bacterium]HEU64773.1 hypothetical protein [Chlamydiota bacterium]
MASSRPVSLDRRSKHFDDTSWIEHKPFSDEKLLSTIKKVQLMDPQKAFEKYTNSWKEVTESGKMSDIFREHVSLHLQNLSEHLLRKARFQSELHFAIKQPSIAFPMHERELEVMFTEHKFLISQFECDGGSKSEKTFKYSKRTEELNAKQCIKKREQYDLELSIQTLKLISYAKFVAKEKNCNLNDFIVEEKHSDQSDYLEILIPDHKYWKSLFEERQEELKVAQEEKDQALADKAAEKLLLLYESDKSKSKSSNKKPNKNQSKKRNNTSKKSRNQKKPVKQHYLNQEKVEVNNSSSSPVEPLQATSLVLNNSKSPSKYKLHQRVLRWQELDLNKIKDFKDRDENNSSISRYENANNNELQRQKVYHNLIGLERILDDPKLKEKYTYSYKYESHNGKRHTGIGLHASVQFEGITKNVIVKLAIDEHKKTIYHMHATEIDKVLGLADLCENLKDHDTNGDEKGEKYSDDDNWEIQGSKSFDIDREDKLIMHIKQKGFSEAVFSFSPLGLE